MKAQEGYSLVEVMIAAAIIGVVAIGLGTMIQQVNKTVAQAQAKVGSLTLAQDLRSQLQAATMCSSALKVPTAIDVSKASAVQVTLGTTTVAEGSILPLYGNITVTDLKLANLKLEGTLLPSTNKMLSADLMVGAKSPDGLNFKPAVALRLLITTSPTGKFINCASGETASLCTDFGGAYDPTTIPVCSLGSATGLRLCSTTAPAAAVAQTGTPTCCKKTESSECSIIGTTTQFALGPNDHDTATNHYVCQCTQK